MDKTVAIERAKELLRTARHAAMATVNEDGSPHNSPYLFLHNDQLTKLHWGSHPESQHSQNILRTGQLFVVLYDADKFERGGLYIRAERGHIADGSELDEALAVHNAFRIKEGKPVISKDYYEGDSPQRMWSADVTGLWVNGSERGQNGLLLRDIRIEISSTDLDAKK